MIELSGFLSLGLKPILSLLSSFRNPIVNGSMRLDGLDAPVEVIRDKWGVPHIYANSLNDLYFAQGFVHGQDRLFQMDIYRRLASGRLAEIIGKSVLDSDRSMRTLMLSEIARQQAGMQSPENHAYMESYASGVNAFIRSKRWPLEYQLLRVRPDFWSVIDTITWSKFMSWELSGNWINEILRARLVDQLGPDLAKELWPAYPDEWPEIAPANGQRQPTPPLAGHEKLVSSGEDNPLLKPPFTVFPDEGLGSNNWAISGKRTTTGKPILANDMHLSLMTPSIWYENHLVCPQMNVTGVTFPGIPGVVSGHNEFVAWGYTDAMTDVQDLYQEHLHQEKDGTYQVESNGGWYPARIVQDEIKVRGGEPEIHRVVVTRHGPVINSLNPKMCGPEPLALKWTSYDDDSMFDSLFAINQAHSCQELHEALRFWNAPVQNVVYADTQGNIAYSLAGRIPIRAHGEGRIPAPGWTDEYDWVGFIPFEQMPYIVNPGRGYLATANNQTIREGYPYFLGFDTLFGDRYERITELISSRDKIDIPFIKKMQIDQVSSAARTFADHIVAAIGDGSAFEPVIAGLRSWDGSLSAHSREAAVYEVFIRRMIVLIISRHLAENPNLVDDGLLDRGIKVTNEASLDTFYRGRGPAFAWLKSVITDPQSHWFDLGHGETRDDVIRLALSETIAALETRLGKDMDSWTWGRLHQVVFNHPMGIAKPMKKFFNRGPFPVGGDGTTVWAAQSLGYNLNSNQFVGPPYRMIVDLGNLSNSISLLAPGQSGVPTSKHYDDQIEGWFSGDYHPMLFFRPDVEQHTSDRLNLLPDKPWTG